MRYRILTAVVLSCCLCLGADSGSKVKGSSVSENQALGIIRVVNTVQASFFVKRGTYVALQELAQDGTFRGQATLQSMKDADSGTIGNYELTVVSSADGKHYSAALIPATCDVAVFSNDRAVIYKAKALGCP
jgi:hypothetical protein